MVAAEFAADARLAADQRPARSTRARSSRRRSGRRSSASRTARRSGRCSRTRSGARTRAARRYLLGGLLVCSHCGERLVARPRSGRQAPLRLREGAGLLRLRQDLHQRRRGRAVRDRGRPAPARLAASCSGRSSGGSARSPDAQRWLAEMEQAQAQLDELAAAYGQPRALDAANGTAARKPIEQRLTTARKQLAQGVPHDRARPLRRQRRQGCAPSGTRSTSASSTRSSPPSSTHVDGRPRTARLQPLRRVAPDAASGVPEQAAPRPSPARADRTA